MMDHFKLRVTTTKAKAKVLQGLMQEEGLEELEIPGIPMAEIDKFLAGERKNLWEVTINGETLITVVTKKEDAEALKMMIGSKGGEDCVLAPVLAKNLQDFIDGKRDTLALLEIARGTAEESPPEPAEELLPGHVK
jgi:hypothetical protein